MSVKKFKFVSPGIFIKEVDRSFREPAAPLVGPVIIGRAPFGPAMRPIRVESFGDFVRTFGNPVSGYKGGDLWRHGNLGGPTYGAYAAQAYLAANVGPVNYVRLLGTHNANKTADAGATAGWTTSKNQTESHETNGGAYGLVLFDSASVSQTVTGFVSGTLAAVWYLEEGSIVLKGTRRNGVGGTAVTSSAALMRTTNAATHECRAIIRDASNAVVKETSFNFDRDSDIYIRKVFNTNPQKINSRFTKADDIEKYWLGQTYDQMVETTITGSGVDHTLAAIVGLKKGSVGFHDQELAYQNGKTGWFIGQDMGVNTAFRATSAQKLFRLVGLEGGASTQRRFKVSIEDIKAPSNPDIYPYGSFSVVLRSLSDTDNKVLVVERFTGCNIDPDSPDYIAKKIGDMYLEWSDSEARFREYGDHPNNSTHIRVEMDDATHNGSVEPSLIPFGVLGPPAPKPIKFIPGHGPAVAGGDSAGSTALDDDATTNAVGPAHVGAYFIGANAIPQAKHVALGNVLGVDGAFSGSLRFPALLMVSSSLDAGLSDQTDAYFGVNTNRSRTSSRHDESVVDYLLPIDESTSANSWDPKPGFEHSYMFSMDDLAYDTALGCMNYVSGSRISGDSYSALNSFSATLDLGYDRFTTVFHGGHDGVNITEMEPFNNEIVKVAGASQYNNYAYNSLHRAITSVADPEFIEMNLLSVPGLRAAGLTNYAMEVCEERGDALAIIDVADGDYTPRTESRDSAQNRRGSVSTAVANMKSRRLNTSYGATYYPWVQILDEARSTNVWVPPSVVALGTLASSEAASAVWFAPAGFNRGGLTDGAAGIPVISARQRLSRKDRDSLYENNVNPIAKFPNEGLVIFGQKTLQAQPSALDRVNVRRLMIYLKKEVSRASTQVLFDQNVESTWNRFKSLVDPILAGVKAQFGLTEYRLILDETTTTPDLIDQNILYAKIMLKPARAIEYIAIDFNIMPTGASFDD
tara:strand:+ start:3751 stop:6675 length:2925 start_codon:yes stop_codon:yes gene_type:complete